MAALPFMILPLTVTGPLPTAGAAAVQLPSGEDTTVLHTGPTPWATPNQLGGVICDTPRECREVYYQWLVPLGLFEPGLAEDVKTMDFALNNTPGNKIASGFSGGARVVSKWLEENADSTAISPEELSILLMGNGGRKYGGVNGWAYGDALQTPTDTQFSILDVARQYDPIADFPNNPFNLLALANAISAFSNVHLRYADADLNAPGNYTWTEGNTTYVYIPTEQLPLLAGLRQLGLGALADQWEAPLREIIDRAYNRDYLEGATLVGGNGKSTTAVTTPTAAAVGTPNPVPANNACTGYNTDGCDITATPVYTPVTAPDVDNIPYQNILPNLFNALISIPRAYLDGLNDLSHSLEVTGSWWVYTPTNVLGYDPADPPKITAVTNLLIPWKALSNPLGESVSWWARANLPMNAGCTGTAPPTCKDANAILSKMFTAPIWDLISGYKMPELNNPVTDAEGAAGEEIPGQEGAPVPWSGQPVQLNPYDPVYSVGNYLFRDPKLNRPEPITFTEVVDSIVRFTKAAIVDFNPFVPGSFLWKGYPYTFVTPFLKPFVKILCPQCDPEHPEDPTPFDGELPPSSQQGATGTTMLASLNKTTDEAGKDGEKTTEQTPGKDVVSTAVSDLLKKFNLDPKKDDATGGETTTGEQTGEVTDGTETGAETGTETDGTKTDTGLPGETKPEVPSGEGQEAGGDENVDKGGEENAENVDKGGEENVDKGDKGGQENVDKGDKGGQENVDKGDKGGEEKADKGSEAQEAGGKHRKSETENTKDTKSDTGSEKASSGSGGTGGNDK